MEEFEKEKRKKRLKTKKVKRETDYGKARPHKDFEEDEFIGYKYKMRDIKDIDLEEEY